ncbi:hypothetical protein ACH40E_33310 [Streptomyces acidicola]|uniref:hypothetical protein n=1 Tax=Streptomyces acidicola TaxID=2596892 RepID=UPI0037BA9B9B
MIPRPLGCDGDECDYDATGWFHVDCELAPSRGASEIRHPSMLSTRVHLAANPLPGQQDRRAS